MASRKVGSPKGKKETGPNSGGRVIDNPQQRAKARKRSMGHFTGKSMDGMLAEQKRLIEESKPAEKRKSVSRAKVRQQPNPPRKASGNLMPYVAAMSDARLRQGWTDHKDWRNLELPDVPDENR